MDKGRSEKKEAKSRQEKGEGRERVVAEEEEGGLGHWNEEIVAEWKGRWIERDGKEKEGQRGKL